jgi:hypothetical protein
MNLIATLATYAAVQGIALIVRPRRGVVSSSFTAAPLSRFSTEPLRRVDP